MGSYVFKGIWIGLLFGVPIGAVGAMTVQRTLASGIKAGLITGLGSSAADCIYASVGAFGIRMVSDFLLRYEGAIHLVGGGFLMIMGMGSILKEPHRVGEGRKGAGTGIFLSAFTVGITNPAAILTFLFAFSYFGLSEGMGVWNGIWLVLGVFMGTFAWWLFLAVMADRFREKAVSRRKQMNRVFGGILVMFGVLIWVRLL
ncbi:MAG: LysE family transporter [Hungatella sp.]|nr:LysE family transporter [Hungatella sp.]MCI9636979.1 LysE family transporter [Hungatella sp.]